MKILVVDDSKAMRMLVSFHLRQAGFKGHTIIEAENGALGLAQVKQEQPDVILSDWNMPEMTGIEFLMCLKQMVDAKEMDKMIPFIFVTSESTSDMHELAINNGALGFITKPFTVEAFEERLSKIIK